MGKFEEGGGMTLNCVRRVELGGWLSFGLCFRCWVGKICGGGHCVVLLVHLLNNK